jgi:RNA polymerase sigma-70 factor (ECF subfamily)
VSVERVVEDLFRRESARLVAALVRVLGAARVALAEDVVHDALVRAMQSWRFGVPDDPAAWLLTVARNRAIDVLRAERRLAPESEIEGAVDLALSPDADAENQLAMMFAVCDEALAPETHVTAILRFLCGLSPPEIARAFLVEVDTIDRRLVRARRQLEERGQLAEEAAPEKVRARQASVEQALYLLFNEGYEAVLPAICADALRLCEILLGARGIDPKSVHALAALFCFGSARLATRRTADGVLVPLEEQDRSQWDTTLVARGIAHLGASVGGSALTRRHLEAGIAFEHVRAPSIAETDWAKIVDYYDALLGLAPDPVIALNRAVALAELRGFAAGRAALDALAGEPKLASYSPYFAARADLARRAGDVAEARSAYERAIALARTDAERRAHERRLAKLAS